jgi:hypothetical protein
MSPSEIRKQTLKQLRAARTGMMSTEWMFALEKADPETQVRAAKELLRVHHAIQKLENAELADIRDKLLENEAALAQGADQLESALENLVQIKAVLKAVAGLLVTAARIVALIA